LRDLLIIGRRRISHIADPARAQFRRLILSCPAIFSQGPAAVACDARKFSGINRSMEHLCTI